jgi:hypothetical protein
MSVFSSSDTPADHAGRPSRAEQRYLPGWPGPQRAPRRSGCRRESRKVEDRGAELPAANEGRMSTLDMQDDALPAVGRIIPVRLVGRGRVNLANLLYNYG